MEYTDYIIHKYHHDYKDTTHVLYPDSQSMGFCAFLKDYDQYGDKANQDKLLGFDLTYDQRCTIYEKYLWVEMFRLFMIGCIINTVIHHRDPDTDQYDFGTNIIE